MVQGTNSDAGKSIFVAALCRIFSDMGYKVAPFKSQNMSLNSFVTDNGEEIARSQVLQSMAARIKPRTEFNPILLKPKGDRTSQIILMGKPYADYHAKNYYSEFIPKLIPYVKKTIKLLRKEYDIIIIEGAGSPAEINLADQEIANMFIARMTNSPVILIADIDRGGVFASIYGTIKLLTPEEQNLIKYFVINKFRGEIDILKSGIDQIEKKTGKECLGVIPFIHDLKLPAEDSVSLGNDIKEGNIKVKIIRLPRISNFTDFEPLSWESDIQITYESTPENLSEADLIIIPGTKNTIKDLIWMEQRGFNTKLRELEKLGYLIIGICGGYQILGKNIIDKGIEDDKEANYQGLGLLPVNTEFLSYDKITRQIKAEIIGLDPFNDCIIDGYEIHMGKVILEPGINVFLKIINKENNSQNQYIGAINEQKNVMGTFLHGFWDNDEFREKFIEFLYSRKNIKRSKFKKEGYRELIEKNIKRLTKVVKESLDFKKILKLIGM